MQKYSQFNFVNFALLKRREGKNSHKIIINMCPLFDEYPVFLLFLLYIQLGFRVCMKKIMMNNK